MTRIRIGLDIAKNVFQAHGVDDNGTVVLRKRLRRPDMLRFFASLPPCLIGIEACSASHHWARELIRLGHEVRVMPARYVKPYVQRGQERCSRCGSNLRSSESPDDAVRDNQDSRAAGRADAAPRSRAPREAADHVGESDPRLPRRIRDRGASGYQASFELIAVINDDADTRILPEARIAMRAVADQLCDLQKRIKEIEQAIRAWHRSNEASRRLATIPGVGSITASAIVATVANATEFKSARHFAAFLGLTPRQCSTGGRQRLGRISKQGDVYIRRLLVLGGTSLVRYARGAGGSVWAEQLLARRPTRIVTVALANKAARVIWALLTRGEVYQAPQPQVA